eukprot:3937271-Rhodomonas_salina.1
MLLLPRARRPRAVIGVHGLVVVLVPAVGPLLDAARCVAQPQRTVRALHLLHHEEQAVAQLLRT